MILLGSKRRIWHRIKILKIRINHDFAPIIWAFWRCNHSIHCQNAQIVIYFNALNRIF